MSSDAPSQRSMRAAQTLQRLWLAGGVAVVAGLTLALTAWPSGGRVPDGSMPLVWVGALCLAAGLVTLVIPAAALGSELGRLRGRGEF